MSGFQQIAPDEFKKLPHESQILIIFGYVYDLHRNQTNQIEFCTKRFSEIEETATAETKKLEEATDKRVTKLENRKKIDTAASSVFGLFGGIIAVVGKALFK